MSWNYRVVKTKEGYGIFEVYYEKSGAPYARKLTPEFNSCSDNLEEQVELLKQYLASKSLPVRNLHVITDAEIGITD